MTKILVRVPAGYLDVIVLFERYTREDDIPAESLYSAINDSVQLTMGGPIQDLKGVEMLIIDKPFRIIKKTVSYSIG